MGPRPHADSLWKGTVASSWGPAEFPDLRVCPHITRGDCGPCRPLPGSWVHAWNLSPTGTSDGRAGTVSPGQGPRWTHETQ